MNEKQAKQTILSYIRPSMLGMVVALISVIGWFYLFPVSLPNRLRCKKIIKKLESEGNLIKAAQELTSANSKKLIKGKVVLGETFMFCKGVGRVFEYNEILWAYQHNHTVTFLIIPLMTKHSLWIGTKDMTPRQIAAMGKDKLGDIKNAILEIYSHNNNCLVGYRKECVQQYKLLKKGK